MTKENIFVMAMDDFHQVMLERLQGSEEMVFHPLLDMKTAVDTVHYDIAVLLDRARRTLEDFPGTVDAIVGYWDFPTCSLLPILRREWNLPGPCLEATLRCEHKYWARTEEAQVAPRQTPRTCPMISARRMAMPWCSSPRPWTSHWNCWARRYWKWSCARTAP